MLNDGRRGAVVGLSRPFAPFCRVRVRDPLSHPQVGLCRASAAAGPSPGAAAVPDDDERGAAAAPLLPAQEHEQRPRVVPRERGLQRLRLAGGHNG